MGASNEEKKSSKNNGQQASLANSAAPNKFCTMCMLVMSVCVAAAAIFIAFVSYNINVLKRFEPIKYDDVLRDAAAHKWHYVTPFFGNDTLDALRELALGGEPLSTIVEDKSVESAGEAVEVGHPNCLHPFMTLTLNRTRCHFSNRLDVGIHFVKTGGFNGIVEYYERMVSRMIPFRNRLITATSSRQQQPMPTVANANAERMRRLPELNSADYIDKLNSICVESLQESDSHRRTSDLRANMMLNKTVVSELFQFDILLMLPGQELPTHLNVPYFWGADRYTLPHWLLVAMKSSHLFDSLFIPQVQSITNLFLDDAHDDDDDSSQSSGDRYVDVTGEGGDFYFYPYKAELKKKPTTTKVGNGEEESDGGDEFYLSKENVDKYVIERAINNAVVMLDGSQIIHGVDRYRASEQPPLLAFNNHHYTIRFDKAKNAWLVVDSKGNDLMSYAKSDVRLMVVWNTHCFRDATERDRFKQGRVDELSLAQISETFKRDLASRGRLPADDIEPLELWTIVLKDYLNYPINPRSQYSTFFGFNYCLLPNILPESISNLLFGWFLKHCSS